MCTYCGTSYFHISLQVYTTYSTYTVFAFLSSVKNFFCKLPYGLSGLKHVRVAYRYIINTIVVFKGDLLVNQICKYEVSSIKLLVKLGVTSFNGRVMPLGLFIKGRC